MDYSPWGRKESDTTEVTEQARMGHHEIKLGVRGRKHLYYKEQPKQRGIDPTAPPTHPEATEWALLPPRITVAWLLGPALSQPIQMEV